MVTSCLLSLYQQLLCFYSCLCAILQVTHCVGSEGTLVFPKLLESRDDVGTKLIKINDDLTLSLEKSSVMGKEFLLRTYQGHVMQHNYLDGEALEEDLYHDPRQLASVIVSEENGLQLEGVLGAKLAIKPFDGQGRSAGSGDVPHLVYKIEDHDGVNAGQDGARPETVYPEMLLVVDSTFRAQFKTNYTLLKYLMVTMNSVNVRYMTVSSPSVRLKFCAMEILTVSQETFILREGKYVHALRTLANLRDHVRNNTEKYGIYDGVYLVTGLDMGERTYYGWNGNLLGYAYIGGICTWQKVGYGEDTVGTFRGIRIMAHEIGHLLGCPHDGTTSGSYSSASCPWNDGYIMSYMEIDSKSMKFSSCCNSMISWHAWSRSGACLLTARAKRKIKKIYYTKLFAGDIMTRDHICRISFPNIPETHFIKDYNGFENCMARCFMPKSVYGYETFMTTFLPDNAACTENNGCRRLLALFIRVSLKGRNEAGQMVIKLTDDITLNLEKGSVVGEDFLLRTYQGDIMEHNYLDGHLLEENLYEDLNYLASLIVSESDGLTVEGVLGNNYGVKPLASQERTTEGNIPHLLYELPRHEYKLNSIQRPVSSFVSQRDDVKKWPPRRAVVELLLIVDSAFRSQFDTKKNLLEYLMISLSSVNIKYRTVSHPEVQIRFCALEIINHKAESVFYVRHQWRQMIAFDTLMRLEIHVRLSYLKYVSYDAVYLITGLDMGAVGYNGSWESGTLGK
ncbi:hypothetical protein MRX96_056362 [Rhipicephalus microplus]